MPITTSLYADQTPTTIRTKTGIRTGMTMLSRAVARTLRETLDGSAPRRQPALPPVPFAWL